MADWKEGSAAELTNQAAEHAHPADRFAREIRAFLMPSCAARLRRLNGKPLGRSHHALHQLDMLLAVA